MTEEMGPVPGNNPYPNQGPAIDHELWLAMQAAHDRYKNTSATLDALTAMSPAGNSSPECRLAIDAAAAEQRAAFENYIESRLQLSESIISRHAGPPFAENGLERGGARFWKDPRISRALLVVAAAAALLIPATFRVGYLEGERREARDIETVRDGADAMLMLLSSQVDPPAGKNASTAASPGARVGGSDVARADAKKPPRPIQMTPRKPGQTSGKVAKNRQELHDLQKRGERNYYEFLFTPWKQTERIGRIRLTVLKVVPGRGFSDISIAVDNRAPDRRRISLNEPVWIDLSGRKAVELVVNRIDGDRVGGYLSEPKYPRLSWSRVSPDLASAIIP